MEVQSLLGETNVVETNIPKQGSTKGGPLSCSKCPLFGGQPIVDDINRNAKVLIIGEAPGKTEVAQGKRFVGDSGQLLRECLEQAGIDIGIVQFENVCRCHPTNEAGLNRAPSTKEMNICSELFLSKAIERFDNIIVVGKIPEMAVFGSTSPTYRGNVLAHNGKRIAATYHPAYILRNSGDRELKKQYVDDFRFFKMVFFENYAPEFTLVDTEEKRNQCLLDVQMSKTSVFDLETRGLDLDSTITVVGIDGDNGVYVIPIIGKYSENIPFIKRLFSFTRKKYVAFNILFDYELILAQGLCKAELDLVDIMIMEHLLDSSKGQGNYKLKPIATKKGFRWSALIANPATCEDLDLLIKYNAEDVINERKLYEYDAKLILEAKLTSVAEKVVFPSINVIGEMEISGVRMDLDEMDAVGNRLKNQLYILETELSDEFGERNWGSSKQLASLLAKLTNKIMKRTPGGSLSTDVEALALYIEYYDRDMATPNREKVLFLCERLAQIKKHKKMLSTYIIGIRKKISNDSRLRGHFSLIGTGTGRLSSSNPNLQNIPRGAKVKNTFIASKGRVLFEGDLSQIELRVVASYAPEPVMIKAYQKGADLHILTASTVCGVPVSEVTKDQRQIAKAVNFGLIYGQSWIGFKAYAKNKFDVILTDKEAQAFREAYFSRYSGIYRWHQSVEQNVRSCQVTVATTPFGRRRRLEDGDVNHVVRQALNTPIQSAGSDCNLLAMRYLWDNCDRKAATFLLTVHDQFMLDVEESYVDEMVELVDKSAKHVEDTCDWLKVPIIFDIKIGDTWGSLKPFEKK